MGSKVGVLDAYCDGKTQRQILLEYVERIPEGTEITYQSFLPLVENGFVSSCNIRNNFAWLCFKGKIEKKYHGVYVRTNLPLSKPKKNNNGKVWLISFAYEFEDIVEKAHLRNQLSGLLSNTRGVTSVDISVP